MFQGIFISPEILVRLWSYTDLQKKAHSTLDIESELENAEHARLAGNEGRARVCARRAAGMAARHFLARHNIRLRDPSAYSALKALVEFPDLSSGLRVAASQGHDEPDPA